MKDKKIRICCILLSFIMLAGTLSISVGEVCARYENRVSCRTILESERETQNGKSFFTETSEAKIIVLAGELVTEHATEKELAFDLEAFETAKSGKISWNTDYEHGKFVNIEMSIGNERLEHEEEISVPENSKKTVTMTVSATSEALSQPHEAMDIDINISWGELGGIFRVSIPAVAEVSEENKNSSESVNTPPPSENETSEESNSSVQLEAAGTTQETVDVPEETTDETEETVTENSVSCIAAFDPKQYLPVKITLASGVTDVVFGLSDENGDVPQNFPAGTKFSIDNGKSFYMIYSEDTVRLKSSKTEGSLLFDFSDTELLNSESISMIMQPWTGSVSQEVFKITSLTNAAKSFETREATSGETLELSGNGETETISGNGFKTFVLNGGNAVELVFPKEWMDAKLTASVQILEIAENGSLVFNNTENVFKEYIKDETAQTHRLVLKTNGNFSDAGTYRVYIIWEYEGIPFFKKGVNFFVNYSTPTSSTLKSQEVPYGN